VRPFAEMNHEDNVYSAYRPGWDPSEWLQVRNSCQTARGWGDRPAFARAMAVAPLTGAQA
jgi:hypothetical protein